MGLDVTVFLGRVHSFVVHQPGDLWWFEVSAVVETMHEARRIAIAKHPEGVACFLYAPAGDGDTRVHEDPYGSQLVAVPIGWLTNELTVGMGEPRLAMLRALIDAAPEWVTHAVIFCH